MINMIPMIAIFVAFISASEACVSYNPKTKTYTVDPSGSVNVPEVKKYRNDRNSSKDQNKNHKNPK